MFFKLFLIRILKIITPALEDSSNSTSLDNWSSHFLVHFGYVLQCGAILPAASLSLHFAAVLIATR
jgi:hypothetical protein